MLVINQGYKTMLEQVRKLLCFKEVVSCQDELFTNNFPAICKELRVEAIKPK